MALFDKPNEGTDAPFGKAYIKNRAKLLALNAILNIYYKLTT